MKNKLIFTFISFFILLIFSISFIFFSIKNLNDKIFIEKLKILENILQAKVDQQYRFTVDWAQWDDTVNFVKTHNISYIFLNIDEDTLKNLEIDFMLFFNSKRDLVYAYFVGKKDKISQKEQLFILKLKTKLYNYLSDSKKIVNLKSFVKIDKDIFIITLHSIVKSSEELPSYGTLILGEKLDFKFIETAKKILHEKIYLKIGSYKKSEVNNLNEFPIYDEKKQIIGILGFTPVKDKSITIYKLGIFSLLALILLNFYLIIQSFSKYKKEEIKEELALLSIAIDNANIGVILTEFNGTIFYVNRVVSEITEYSKEELLGKNYAILLKDKNALNNIVEEFKKGKKFWKKEIVGLSKTGKNIELEITIIPIFDEDNKKRIKYFVTTCDEISERKKLFEDLKRMKAQLEDMDKLKTAFMLNLSHEVKTPLTGIKGFVELLEETNLDENQKLYINLLKDSTERLESLLENLIEFAKLETGSYVVKENPFRIPDLINKILTKFKPLAEKKSLKFIVDISPRVPSNVIGDDDILLRLIQIFIDNAIKFTDEGEIILSIDLIEKKGKFVKLIFKIKDTGIGILPDKLENIFLAFYQDDFTTKRKYEGLGLGLSLAKKYLNLINGEIEVQSKVGEGTEFSIKIPFTLEV